MKKSLVTLTALAAAAFAAQGVVAQTATPKPGISHSQASAPPSTKARADVKAEAATANKTDMVVKGEGTKSGAASAASMKDRPAVKAEANAANKGGDMVKGEGTKNPDSNSGAKK